MKINSKSPEIIGIPFNSRPQMYIETINEDKVTVNVAVAIGESITYINAENKEIKATVTGFNTIRLEGEGNNEGENIELPFGAVIRIEKEDKTIEGILVKLENYADITYNAEDLQEMYYNTFVSGFSLSKKNGKIEATGGLEITIGENMGVIDGISFYWDSAISLVLAPGSNAVRIDSIVLRKNQIERSISLAIKKGTPNINPKPPKITEDHLGIYELKICDVQVEAQSLNISQKSINDKRKLLTLSNFAPTIGDFHTQYTNEDGIFLEEHSPATLYPNTTWKIFFNQDSVTFRTEGSLSNEGRGSDGIQGDSIRNIFGYVSGMAEMSLQTLPTGPFYFVTEGGGYASGGPWGTKQRLYFDASRVVPTGNENRMRNRLMRVWQRIA